MKKTIVVALCGASGAIYGLRLLKALLARPVHVHLCVSEAGRKVMIHETAYKGGAFKRFLNDYGCGFHAEARLDLHEPDNLFAPPASGSFRHDGMVVAPCSMKTLSAIASGLAEGLIGRAADVCLKEKRPLILMTRETPLSVIHINNMARAAAAGAVIMPPCPGFYHQPETIEDLVDHTVGRILDHLNIEHDIVKQWGVDDTI